jgi:hypothetical protein
MAAKHRTIPIQKIGEWWIGRRSRVSGFIHHLVGNIAVPG